MLHRRANLIAKPIRRATLSGIALWASISAALAEPADGWFSVVHESDGLQATTYTDCDNSAYAVVALTDSGAAERYAARGKFAEKVEPQLSAIISAATTWLDGEGGQPCDTAVSVETITVIGTVNALPVYVTTASRAAAWQPGSAASDARDVATFAAALPALDATRCTEFEETVAPKLDKYRTRIFTIRAAHTTGQWSHMQALTKLIPVHQEIMGLMGDWSMEWQCPGIFDLAGVAILADVERAALLKWTEQKILARVAEASSPDELATVRGEVFRSSALPPVSSLFDIVDQSAGAIRYGGYLSPTVEQFENVFAGAEN